MMDELTHFARLGLPVRFALITEEIESAITWSAVESNT